MKPQLSLAQERDLVLDSYVMHINTHHCRNCTSTEQFSTLYEVWVLPKHPTTKHLKARMSLLPLDPKLIPGVPPNLHGRAHAELALLTIQRGIITDLKGRIEAHDLEDRSGANTPLGSYVVIFPGGGNEPVGKLHDLDGPLALEGTLRLTRQPGFELEGLIAARRGAPPELVNNIQWLGSPDASGRRPFSLSGTF